MLANLVSIVSLIVIYLQLYALTNKNKPNDLGKNLRRGRGKMSKVEVIWREEKGEHRKENTERRIENE